MSIFTGRLSRKNFGLGFLLLFIPIPVVGVLTSIVLVSLNEARILGADAAIKSNMTDVRLEAEISWTEENGYEGVCTNLKINATLSDAGFIGSGDTTNFGCYSVKESYVAVAPLKSKGYACVDSSGVIEVIAGTTGGGTLCQDFPSYQISTQ